MEMIKKILMGIVLLIMVVTIIGATAVNVDNSAEAMTIDARCVASGCVYNESASPTEICVNSTQDGACTGSYTNTVYPLETLFNTGGVVTLVFMGLALLLAVGVGMRTFKNR